MQIRLIHTEAQRLRLEKAQPDSPVQENRGDAEDRRLKLSVHAFSDIARMDVFGLFLGLGMRQQPEIELEIDFVAWFEADGPITEDFLQSQWALVNAPAIAFPFLRSFVSTLTLNAGYRPVLLPTINFLKMYENRKPPNAPEKQSAASQ